MRLLEIVFYLLRCNSKVKIKELAIMFDVSKKTIQRDLDKLSVLGIPIIVHRGKNGGVEIDKNYIIARQILKYSDYEALILALYIGESVSKKVKDSHLIDKFRMVDKDKCSKLLDKYTEKFIVDLCENNNDFKNHIMNDIDKTLENQCSMEVELKSGKIIVYPISYVLRKEGLSLYCYQDGYKLILIDEILDIDISNKTYCFNKIEYLDNKNNVEFIH